jgi:uncharacterized coiled-coil DUF342 family protein
MAAVLNGDGGRGDSTDHSASVRDQETPPPVPPKDNVALRSPRPMSINAYFGSPRHSRTNSVYSLSKASFSHQLNQLTSLHLPDAASLSSTIAAIPTSTSATKALSNAGAQIRQWIQKAEEVLGGLDADDDIEWAAAGKDGVDDMDKAMREFKVLVNVWVQSLDDLQKRPDIDDVPKDELRTTLDSGDRTVSSWGHVQQMLLGIKEQVQLALEWEELWNTTLGGIGQETENLKNMIFEMEEQRHKSLPDEEAVIDSNVQLDISELQTIVEENPVNKNNNNNLNGSSGKRLSLLPALSNSSPHLSPRGFSVQHNKSNESMMGLYARLQPLRTSLDFLPMRLESFRSAAERYFPSSCEELDDRRDELEGQFDKLKEDADRLKEELAEDHWVAAFRNADRQVRKIVKSMEIGIAKLQDALESGFALTNPSNLNKKIADYEAKKNHYAPSLQKVIEIIDTGVRDRRTINGEVLRIQSDAKELWERLQNQIKEIDTALDELTHHHQHNHHTNQQMRDSVSTIVSNDISLTEGAVETPGSSPASSVHTGLPRGKKGYPSTPDSNGGSRNSSIRSVSGTRWSAASGKPRTASNASFSRRASSNNPMARITSMSPSPGSRATSSTPTPNRPGASTPVSNKPRWNSSPVVKPGSGYFIKPVTTGSPHSRTLNGKPITPKPSVYAYRAPSRTTSRNASVSTTNLVNSSPLARDAGPPASSHHPSSFGARMAARAASTPNRTPVRNAYNTPPSATRTPPSINTSGTSNKNDRDSSSGRPRSRAYKPVTPNLPVRIPAAGSSSSSGKRISLLPIPAGQLYNGVTKDDINEAMCQGGDSPTFKATVARRPATSMASGRRNSLLPIPKE